MSATADRILTTHSGSLPRSDALLANLQAVDAGEDVNREELARQIEAAVKDTVRNELDAGLDIVNDGEVGRPSYATYVKDRLTGMTGSIEVPLDMADDEFPDFEGIGVIAESIAKLRIPACDGPLSYIGQAELQTDIDNVKAAVGTAKPAGLFMSAASPGILSYFSPNTYYGSDEEYLWALGEAMQVEYEQIHEAGMLLQLDCPDFAYTEAHADASPEDLRKRLEQRIEVLNHAVRNIPAEAMRVHVCWGNGEWPRTHDVPLRDIIETVFKAKPAGIMLMSANGRHSHEWAVFQDIKLPEGKYLLPGVIDTSTNIVEHPEAVAQRLVQYAGVVGRENVVAATDCGFATAAGAKVVATTVAWAKLRSMAEGARIASEQLWA